MVGEVVLISSGTEAWSEDLTSGNFEVGNERARAVADVVSILLFDRSRDRKSCLRGSLQGLDSRLLVAERDMNAALVKDRRTPVEVADLLGGCVERRLVSFVQLQPVAHAVRSKGLLLKDDPQIGWRCFR